MEEHVVLYRQFRPLTFDDVTGQKASVGALRQAVISGRLAHAYLFCGQHGTGKTTIAKIFSRAVNCEHPVNGNPCNECPTCKGILDGSILDVVEMDAASNNGVDDIRPILREVNFTPTRTKYKVYIIDEVHMLSKGAFNALLKTIEEPPAHVIFLFATTEVEKIPSTIISRCQRYEFRRIPANDIVKRLREVSDKVGIKIDDDALKLIASRSDGALRDALSLLDQISHVTADKESTITTSQVEQITGTVDSTFLFKMANCLIDGHFGELVELCSALRDSGKNQTVFTLDLAAYFRDLLIIRVHADPLIYLPYPTETIKDMYQTANKVSADTLAGFISYLSKEYPELRRSPDIPTSFEIMLMRLCGRKANLPVTPIKMPDSIKTSSDTKEKPAEQPKEEPKEEKKETSVPSEPVKKEEEPEKKPEKPVIKAPWAQPSSPINAPVVLEKEAKEEEKEEKKPEPEKESGEADEKKEESKPSSPALELSFFKQFSTSSEEKESKEEPEKKDISPVSFTSFMGLDTSEKGEEKTEEKKEESPAKPSPTSNTGIFAGLSDSFFDDLTRKTEEPEKKKEPEKAPHTSQLAEQLSQNGLIVDGRPREHVQQVRQPSISTDDADIAVKWKSMVSNISAEYANIGSILDKSSLKKTGDSVYIVFENADQRLMSNLKGVATFRTVSSNIKEEMGAAHLYLCTHSQYQKVLQTAAEKESEKKMEELKNLAESKGINTDIHFGE
ncbi:MAG: DNA polymerase III subunit gamma/tau [Saccharofermentans sp.]|nr:DNA polymerase III subunit gamma/tau [Saccharofermentans sp.]